MPNNPLTVFISSTCRDLADLRSSLAAYLRQNMFEVRVSEDSNSGFYVEPNQNTIRICLNNIEAADAVICIIDRRYGGHFDYGEYKSMSATHMEVAHARKQNKPVFYFIRDASWQDFEIFCKNPQGEANWVDETEKRLLFGFLGDVVNEPGHAGSPN